VIREQFGDRILAGEMPRFRDAVLRLARASGFGQSGRVVGSNQFPGEIHATVSLSQSG